MFKRNSRRYILWLLLPFAVAGCSSHPHIEGAQYWERSNLRDSLNINGAEKQKLLDRDIARCVTAMREIEATGNMRAAVPADSVAGINADQATLNDWDTPERDGELLMEHSDYHDFDGCMMARGWERVEYLSYPAAAEAEEVYLESRGIETPRQKEQKENEPKETSGSSYFNL